MSDDLQRGLTAIADYIKFPPALHEDAQLIKETV